MRSWQAKPAIGEDSGQGGRVWTAKPKGAQTSYYQDEAAEDGDSFASRGDRSKGRGKSSKGSKGSKGNKGKRDGHTLKRGDEVTGTVSGLAPHGVFVDIGEPRDGFLPWQKCTLPEDQIRIGQTLNGLSVDNVSENLDRVNLRGPAQELTWSDWKPDTDPAEIDADIATDQGGGWWSQHGWDTGEGKKSSKNSYNRDSWWWSQDEDRWQEQEVAEWNTSRADEDSWKPLAAEASEKLPPSEPTTRDETKAAIFAQLDTDGDGYLKCFELRPFAELTGFDGNDSAWVEEYALLCQEQKCEVFRGLDVASFGAMVDDDSDNGCYCSDAELANILQKVQPAMAEKTIPQAAPTPSAALHQPAAAQETPVASCPETREGLKRAVFELFDQDSDNYLNKYESLQFARGTGFDGTVDEWPEEYMLLCQEVCADPDIGIDFASFSILANDDSDNGCFCTDAEMSEMLKAKAPAHSTPAQPATMSHAPGPEVKAPLHSKAPPQSRAELKKAVFCLFDVNTDGYLDKKELLPFVRKTGFDGTNDDWDEEYRLLCEDLGCELAQGVSAQQFLIMLDDDSDEGCYCTENELRAMLGQSAEETPAAITATPDHADDPLTQDFDPWAAALKSHDKGKQKGKGKHAKGKGESKGQKQVRPTEDAVSAGAADPWAHAQDPWSAPAAVKAKENQQKAQKEAEQEAWGKWREDGKPGVGPDPSKPVMDAQRLLEASRAAIAARKAREAEAEKNKIEIQEDEQEIGNTHGTDFVDSKSAEDDDEDSFWATGGSDVAHNHAQRLRQLQSAQSQKQISFSANSSSSTAPATLPKRRAESMPVALAGLGACVAKLAMGDRNECQELAATVLGAPCVPHATAVASSALRSLFLGRSEEARTLLVLDELLLLPPEGDIALLQALEQLAQEVGPSGAPLLLRVLVAALSKTEDKQNQVRAAAVSATEAIVRCCDPFAFEALLPALLAGLDARRAPAMKLHVLRLLKLGCKRGKDGENAIAEKMPELLPVTTSLLVDTSLEVRQAATETTEYLMALSGNTDLEPFLDEILRCVKGSCDVATCVRNLAEVVFVQRVSAPALAVVLPVLTKGLKSRNAKTQRQAAIIAENMGRLVSAVADVRPFAPQLLPPLLKVSEAAADPDVRAVAKRAHQSIARVAEADTTGAVRKECRSVLDMSVTEAEVALAGAVGGGRDIILAPCPPHVRDVVLDHAVLLCLGLGRHRHEQSAWSNRLLPLLEPAMPGGGQSSVMDSKALLRSLREVASRLSGPAGKGDVDSEDSDADRSPLLCDCTFTLACGAATLLTEARLQLRRGRVYGLVGGNDSGKSTLLRAIHDRRVSGFPTARELTTALVEHGVGEKAPDCDMTPLEWLLQDPLIKRLGLSQNEAVAALKSMGFDEGARLKGPIKTLSGGWRMKLGLARAMLQAADVVLLDEPTGHLDVTHISWLVDYVNGLNDDNDRMVTTLVVSHDAPFLDRVCTDIIHVNDNKLQNYMGNFSGFLERVPDAQLGSNAEEEQSLPAFTLPEPGALEGVRSKGKRFLYLQNVFFTYPGGTGNPAVRKATVECSLKSRVAIMGPNGAGKSTVAALVVGELAPDAGSAWRHPNLRMAFVAQHAFHHLEAHLDLTATEYILWRFQGNEDREAFENRAKEEEECLEPKVYRHVDERLEVCASDHPQALEPEVIVDRRQRGRLGYEYEMRWRNRNTTSWLSRLQVASMGCLGMAKREDERQAAQRSLSGRPLTTPAVEAHLAGFGLCTEEASHRRLGALSSGQRARAVLAASTWLAPHLLVLDEPTNYLDQPALAALAAGLKVFGGGVLIISHTVSFVDEVCTERWIMQNGILRREGAADVDEDEAPVSAAAAAAAAAKELKEKKKAKRLKELRRRFGQDVSDDEEEWWDDLLKKTNAKNTKE